MNRFTFYPNDAVWQWLQEQPRKQAAVNAACEAQIQQDAEIQKSLVLLREAVDSLRALETSVTALVQEFIEWRQR